MRPKVIQSPSEWHTHQVDPVEWYKSLKAELQRIEDEERWQDSSYSGS